MFFLHRNGINVQFIELHSKPQKKLFVEFIYKVYKNDPFFVDTSVLIAKMFLYKTDTFTRESMIKPVAVQENGNTVAQCFFIYNSVFPYLQIGFFDALPNKQNAVNILLEQAKLFAKDIGVSKIVIGLNGHVSYGVGILTKGFEKKISFDSLYNKEYYSSYFNAFCDNRQTLTTYTFTLDDIVKQMPAGDRIYRSFTYRQLDMKRFKNEMLLFGTLCNSCLGDTFLYFNRSPICFWELMSGLKPFLRPENLIFALKNGKEIGFMLWHPDYNQILDTKSKNPLYKIAIRYYTRRARINTVKVNAIGVIPQYQRTGAIIGLFMEGLQYAKNKYAYGETNFVWDNNTKSRMLNLGLCNHEDRKYATYIIDVA